MPNCVWSIADLHIRKPEKQDMYSVRVRLSDDEGNRACLPARKVKARSKDDAVVVTIAYRDEPLGAQTRITHVF